MRCRALRPTLAILVATGFLLAAMPAAEAAPLPQTAQAARHVATHAVKDTLQLADDQAHALDATVDRADRAVARALTQHQRAPGLQPLLTFLQPALAGQNEFVAIVWIAPTHGTWEGVYWVESELGIVTPRTLTVGAEGKMLALDAGRFALTDEASIVYHFVGPNMTHWRLDLGTIPVYADAPDLGHPAFSGAAASAHTIAHLPHGAFVAPWNLADVPLVMGVTLRDADGAAIDEFLAGGCADAEANHTEAGCRVLWAFALGDTASLDLWHLDPVTGARVHDETLTREQLVEGHVLRVA